MEEEIVIDLTNVPLKPIGKKEISQLEAALMIGTLYRPEVLELIKDPIERATWIDSLAIAAAAFARYKAGTPIPEIAEELGRSETTIRSHLGQKTKAGKLVAETYEKIRRGELKIPLPLIGAPKISTEEELRALKGEVEALKERNRALEEEVGELKREIENLRGQLSAKEAEITDLRQRLENADKEKERVLKKCSEVLEGVKRVKSIISEALSVVEGLTTSY
ncbi:MAG: transcriptional regulator [Desulfurococcaceae archaeon]